jgi:hypothetical protein
MWRSIEFLFDHTLVESDAGGYCQGQGYANGFAQPPPSPSPPALKLLPKLNYPKPNPYPDILEDKLHQ